MMEKINSDDVHGFEGMMTMTMTTTTAMTVDNFDGVDNNGDSCWWYEVLLIIILW